MKGCSTCSCPPHCPSRPRLPRSHHARSRPRTRTCPPWCVACLPACASSGLLITERTPLLLLTDGLVVLQDIFEPTVTQVPPGFLGQIVVYKSGKAKIKLGDTLFDVRTTHPLTFTSKGEAEHRSQLNQLIGLHCFRLSRSCQVRTAVSSRRRPTSQRTRYAPRSGDATVAYVTGG